MGQLWTWNLYSRTWQIWIIYGQLPTGKFLKLWRHNLLKCPLKEIGICSIRVANYVHLYTFAKFSWGGSCLSPDIPILSFLFPLACVLHIYSLSQVSADCKQNCEISCSLYSLFQGTYSQQNTILLFLVIVVSLCVTYVYCKCLYKQHGIGAATTTASTSIGQWQHCSAYKITSIWNRFGCTFLQVVDSYVYDCSY